MTARLATAADAAYITKAAATIGQRYSPEWALELLTDSRYIVVADDDGGYFWVARDTPDKTLVRAGYAIGETDEQVKGLYKTALTEALVRWPEATILESRQKPGECQPGARLRSRRCPDAGGCHDWRFDLLSRWHSGLDQRRSTPSSANADHPRQRLDQHDRHAGEPRHERGLSAVWQPEGRHRSSCASNRCRASVCDRSV